MAFPGEDMVSKPAHQVEEAGEHFQRRGRRADEGKEGEPAEWRRQPQGGGGGEAPAGVGGRQQQRRRGGLPEHDGERAQRAPQQALPRCTVLADPSADDDSRRRRGHSAPDAVVEFLAISAIESGMP